jgi:hypothetical protein
MKTTLKPSPATGLGALRFHLTPRSANAKTGPIPVSTSSQTTCPASCPFMGNGCYAASGPLAIHWAAVTRGNRGMPWREFLLAVAALPAGQLWRHNQAGDLFKPGTANGRAALMALVDANRGRRGYSYSHHKRTPAVIAAFRAATANGFTVNASCHSEAEADAAMANGLRAVFVVPSSETRPQWQTAGGNRAIVCPAQRSGPRFAEMTCERCRLCQSRPSNVAIAFLAHGTGRGRVESVLAEIAADA